MALWSHPRLFLSLGGPCCVLQLRWLVPFSLEDKNRDRSRVSPDCAKEFAKCQKTCSGDPSGFVRRLSAYMATATQMNQRELIGLLRCLQNLKAGQTHAATVIRDAMLFFVRADIVTKFSKEILPLRTLFDEALSSHFVSSKRDGVTLHSFWHMHKDIASLVLPGAEVEEVLAAEQNWSSVAIAIAGLSSGTRLGNRMFGFAHVFVASELTSNFMNGLLTNLGHATMTASWFQEASAACLRGAERLKANGSFCFCRWGGAGRRVPSGHRCMLGGVCLCWFVVRAPGVRLPPRVGGSLRSWPFRHHSNPHEDHEKLVVLAMSVGHRLWEHVVRGLGIGLNSTTTRSNLVGKNVLRHLAFTSIIGGYLFVRLTHRTK